jgi:hypothetical protein
MFGKPGPSSHFRQRGELFAMNLWIIHGLVLCLTASVAVSEEHAASPKREDNVLVTGFCKMTKDSSWREVSINALSFRTFHPQGMTAVGDKFYLSSVEVVDRKADKGVGHLFEIDRKGNMLREMTLGEGAVYHPGGIDYDGKLVWVPVAAYHPDSSAIVYAIDPETFKSREVFRFKDHLGAISHFPDKKLLVAASWGSRRFYRWRTAENNGEWTVTDPEHPEMFPNGSHYVDYQDVQRIPGTPYLLCSGLQTYEIGGGKLSFMKLGGIDLVNVEDLRPVHQVPVPLRPALLPAWTQNPFYVEPTESGLRFYFIPEDEKSSIHVFEVSPTP